MFSDLLSNKYIAVIYLQHADLFFPHILVINHKAHTALVALLEVNIHVGLDITYVNVTRIYSQCYSYLDKELYLQVNNCEVFVSEEKIQYVNII